MAQMVIGPMEIRALLQHAQTTKRSIDEIGDSLEMQIKNRQSAGPEMDSMILDHIASSRRNIERVIDIINNAPGPHQNNAGASAAGGEELGDSPLTRESEDGLRRICDNLLEGMRRRQRSFSAMAEPIPEGISRIPGGSSGNGKPRMRGSGIATSADLMTRGDIYTEGINRVYGRAGGFSIV